MSKVKMVRPNSLPSCSNLLYLSISTVAISPNIGSAFQEAAKVSAVGTTVSALPSSLDTAAFPTVCTAAMPSSNKVFFSNLPVKYAYTAI